MIYKDFKGMKLSQLGMGSMRLPVIGGDDSKIDESAAMEMVDYAIRNGINYFDTAWGYHGGNSETVMGKALSRYPRESFYLASKFPGYDLSNMDKVEEIFEKQLEKCRVGYFDFYLVHNVCEMNIDEYLNEEHGIHAYLTQQKKNGRIRHLGFSVHGSYEVMMRFLDAYGHDMEFCQIQLNYLDYDFQNAKAKVEKLNELDIPVWVMEPLRGGRLCRLKDDEKKRLSMLDPDRTPQEWAFRFLQGVPGVTVILSGMSDLEQMKENIFIFSKDQPLSSEETRAITDLAGEMVNKIALPCTACRYCVSHGPMGLDITGLLELYNEHAFTEGGFIAPMALSAIPEDKQPSACIGCGSCEEVCPQQIHIPDVMEDFVERLNG